MEQHKKKELAKNEVCRIVKCSCGTYHISYRFLTLNLNKHGFMDLLQACEHRERQQAQSPNKHAFHLSLTGMTIHVSNEDFPSFQSALHWAAASDNNPAEMPYQIAFPSIDIQNLSIN
jgi:hypothetical protein